MSLSQCVDCSRCNEFALCLPGSPDDPGTVRSLACGPASIYTHALNRTDMGAHSPMNDREWDARVRNAVNSARSCERPLQSQLRENCERLLLAESGHRKSSPLATRCRHSTRQKQSFNSCSKAALQRPAITALIVEVRVAAHWETLRAQARKLALTRHQTWCIRLVVPRTGLSCRNRRNAWTALCSVSP